VNLDQRGGRLVPDPSGGAGYGRAAPRGLAESVYIGHTVTSAGGGGGALAGAGPSAMLPTLVLTDGAGAAATPGGIGASSSRSLSR
jgi:hypothetical protein